MASTSETSNKVTGYLKKIIGEPTIAELFPLTSNEKIVIGRHKQAVQIWIPDPNISRAHCVLKYSGSGWCIQDLKSMNGTFLNGMMIVPNIIYALEDGARIHLGPPLDAPVAFIFVTKIPNEQSCVINMTNCNQRNEGTTRLPIIASSIFASSKSVKRPSDPEDSGANGNFSPRKNLELHLLLLVDPHRFQTFWKKYRIMVIYQTGPYIVMIV